MRQMNCAPLRRMNCVAISTYKYKMLLIMDLWNGFRKKDQIDSAKMEFNSAKDK